MRTWTLGEIRDRVRETADLENSDFVGNDVLNRFIDQAYTELVDILNSADINLFETSVDITIDDTTGVVSLPEDHYKTLAVDYQVSTDRYEPLESIGFSGRNSYRGYGAGRATAYRVFSYSLQFYPTPSIGQVYRHYYAAVPARISDLADSTIVDGIAGWEQYLVVLASKYALMKENSDVSELLREEAKLKARVEQAAADRQQPQKIVDTRSRRSRRYPRVY